MRATLSCSLETNIESCCDKGEAAAEGRGVCILHARGNARMAQPWCGGNFRHTPRKSSHIMHGVSNVYGKASLLCQPCLSVGPLKIAILSTWHSSKPLSHGTFFGMFETLFANHIFCGYRQCGAARDSIIGPGLSHFISPLGPLLWWEIAKKKEAQTP